MLQKSVAGNTDYRRPVEVAHGDVQQLVG